jgi:hypothetical protein
MNQTSADNWDVLATFAESYCGRSMDETQRARFDALIDDACIYWNNRAKSLSQRRRIENLRRLGADARNLAKSISRILLTDERVLDSLECAAAEIPASTACRPPRIHGEPRGAILGWHDGLCDRLLVWSDMCAIAAAAKLSQPRRARPNSEGAFEVTVYCLARAWKIGSGQAAGTSSIPDTNKRGGPFVRFVHKAWPFVDPVEKRRPSGDRIQFALELIRDSSQE